MVARGAREFHGPIKKEELRIKKWNFRGAENGGGNARFGDARLEIGSATLAILNQEIMFLPPSFCLSLARKLPNS
jgi:hypothetical protein